jgi:uncharacterized protein (TIGR02145 family)
MMFFNRQWRGRRALLLTVAAVGAVIVAVIPKTVWAETICNACKGTGFILELTKPCPCKPDILNSGICESMKGCKGGLLGPPCKYCGGLGVILTPAEKEALRKIQQDKETQKKIKEEKDKAETYRAKAKQALSERIKKGGYPFTDDRDGKTYLAVEIGGQVWMAQNLNYNPASGGSWCYDNNNSYCEAYGRLYDWKTAKTVCPSGYHLPTNAEWGGLVAAVGGSEVAGKHLKTTSGWMYTSTTISFAGSGSIREEGGNGLDSFGFSALPSGSFGKVACNRSFCGVSTNCDWWTATERSGGSAHKRGVYYASDLVWDDDANAEKSNGYSVRCVMDDKDYEEFKAKARAEEEAKAKAKAEEDRVKAEADRVRAEAYQAKERERLERIQQNTLKFTDKRDGKEYTAVRIGGQLWMAQNLNYKPPRGDSWCSSSYDRNCNQYGLLYNWKTANKVCPSGYHLPSFKELNDLVAAVGGKQAAGKKLKSTSGWNNNGNGTDDFGFSALPGGYFFYGAGTFGDNGGSGYWWLAEKKDSRSAYNWSINSGGDLEVSLGNADGGLSVRCVSKD